MQRCLDLAKLGMGKVSPNPMVGALVVYRGRIVGEGWHQKYGEAHAEVNAIEEALKSFNKEFPEKKSEFSNLSFKDSILYVSLEPCSHHGKTPPCADLILFHEIPEVIIACLDSNPLVGGRGIEKLKSHGIKVRTGILEEEAFFLNRRFFTYIEKKRPYIILKWAETQNHWMAPNPHRPFWISSEITNRLNHRWRTEEDAILIGKNTAILDNPHLTSRYWRGKNPKRVLIDWNLETPIQNHIFNSESPSYIFNGLENKTHNQSQYIQLETRAYALPYILFQLYLYNIQSILIEGGAHTLNRFIESDLWDEAIILRSSQDFIPENRDSEETGIPAPILPKSAHLYSKMAIGEDTIFKSFAIKSKHF
jgi:diaminohydroxyphosphoribosylaminopyrimidine deaminase/5-amino-6-(5-phosphoribosylamino)uracil reductase